MGSPGACLLLVRRFLLSMPLVCLTALTLACHTAEAPAHLEVAPVSAPQTIGSGPRPKPVGDLTAPPPQAAKTTPATPKRPIYTATSLRAHGAAQARVLRGKPKTFPALRLETTSPGERLETTPPDAETPADAVPGWFTPVEGDDVLSRFHPRLRELGNSARPTVRVAMFGASGTAADLATGYVRAYLQNRFGSAGPGFVPFVPLSRWYRHSEAVVTASKGWKREHAQRPSGRMDGLYGWLGASFYTTRARQWAQIEPKRGSLAASKVSRVELYFLSQPGGGRMRLRIDGKVHATISTQSDTVAAGYHQVKVATGSHVVRIETLGDGEVRVFGVVLEGDSGVVVDVLGVGGTRVRNMNRWGTVWDDNAKHRGVDLVTLSYGTNESVDTDEPLTAYRADLVAALTRLRATLPEADCLLLTPGDYPLIVHDVPGPRPRLLEIIALQRELAPTFGCGVWQGMAFMGGSGAMVQFVEASPPLARGDFLHFNARGAARKGMAISDALMLEYDAAEP